MQTFIDAAITGDLGFLKENIHQQPSSQKNRALFYAVKHGHYDITSFLLLHGAIPEQNYSYGFLSNKEYAIALKKTENEWVNLTVSCLHVAFIDQNIDILTLLLKYSNIENKQLKYQLSLYEFATKYNATLLLKKAWKDALLSSAKFCITDISFALDLEDYACLQHIGKHAQSLFFQPMTQGKFARKFPSSQAAAQNIDSLNCLLPFCVSKRLLLNEALLVAVLSRKMDSVKILLAYLNYPISLEVFRYKDYMLQSEYDKNPPYYEEIITFLHAALIFNEQEILKSLFPHVNLGSSKDNCLSLYEFAEKYNFKESLREAWQDSFPDKQFYTRTDVTLMLETHSEHFPRLLKKEECQHLFWMPARLGYFKDDYPIIHAATLEKTEFLRLLLSDKKSQDAALLAKSLYSATRFNRLEAIKILLQHGAKPSFEFYDCHIYSKTGVINLFQLVLTKKNMDILKLFFTYCNCNFTTHTCGSLNNFASANQLVGTYFAAWALSIKEKKKFTRGDLCLALLKGDLELLKTITTAGCGIKATDILAWFSEYSQHHQEERYDVACMVYLIETAPPPLDVLNKVLHKACRYGYQELVEVLLQHGVQPGALESYVYLKEEVQLSAIHLALTNKHLAILEIFLKFWHLDTGAERELSLYQFAKKFQLMEPLINAWSRSIHNKEELSSADITLMLELDTSEVFDSFILRKNPLWYTPARVGEFKGMLPIMHIIAKKNLDYLKSLVSLLTQDLPREKMLEILRPALDYAKFYDKTEAVEYLASIFNLRPLRVSQNDVFFGKSLPSEPLYEKKEDSLTIAISQKP